MIIADKEAYLEFISTLPKWHNPGWVKNTEIRNEIESQGHILQAGHNLLGLRKWENALQQEGRMYNGKNGGNYSVNPIKLTNFPGTIRRI